MNLRDPRTAVWGVWGLVAAFAVVDGVAWAVTGGAPRPTLALVHTIAAWIVVVILAVVARRRIGGLARRVTEHETTHTVSLDRIDELEMQNAILEVISRSVDVPLAFQSLAQRIIRLVACDRVGLALLSENGQEFQTYTARVHEDERRIRPRPEIVFKIDRTALGSVVRSREPLIINDTSEGAADFLDVNVLHSAGLGSALIVPLVAKGRALGTINVVSRQTHAFHQRHVDMLMPVAEIFALAYVAQQLQIAVGKHRSMETTSELTLAIAAEINSALQTIIGHCDLLERGYPNPDLQRDLSTVVYQAQRISGLLDKMRAAAHNRLKEVTAAVNQGGIPTSPEAFGETEVT
jgi:transcriptional regulator with GAF, ATPase, and Fis domain